MFARISLMTALLLSTGCAHPAVAATPRPQAGQAVRSTPSVVGTWQMALHVGDKVFQDQVLIRRDPSGALGGTLTVPNNFTAPLERVQVTGDRLHFEIMAPEGATPYRVRYMALLAADGKAMAGFAALEDGTRMGSFVAALISP